MKITVRYTGQSRSAAGVPSEEIELSGPAAVTELVKQIAHRHEEKLRALLLDTSGAIQPSLLLFVNNEQVLRGDTSKLKDGDEVTIMAPISGG